MQITARSVVMQGHTFFLPLQQFCTTEKGAAAMQ